MEGVRCRCVRCVNEHGRRGKEVSARSVAWRHRKQWGDADVELSSESADSDSAVSSDATSSDPMDATEPPAKRPRGGWSDTDAPLGATARAQGTATQRERERAQALRRARAAAPPPWSLDGRVMTVTHRTRAEVVAAGIRDAGNHRTRDERGLDAAGIGDVSTGSDTDDAVEEFARALTEMQVSSSNAVSNKVVERASQATARFVRRRGDVSGARALPQTHAEVRRKARLHRAARDTDYSDAVRIDLCLGPGGAGKGCFLYWADGAVLPDSVRRCPNCSTPRWRNSSLNDRLPPDSDEASDETSAVEGETAKQRKARRRRRKPWRTVYYWPLIPVRARVRACVCRCSLGCHMLHNNDTCWTFIPNVVHTATHLDVSSVGRVHNSRNCPHAARAVPQQMGRSVCAHIARESPGSRHIGPCTRPPAATAGSVDSTRASRRYAIPRHAGAVRRIHPGLAGRHCMGPHAGGV